MKRTGEPGKIFKIQNYRFKIWRSAYSSKTKEEEKHERYSDPHR
jgi:hypothetical protein